MGRLIYDPSVEREHILAEIRRTAAENAGKPLGRNRFAAATGIREHDWSGRYWARWSDAVAEAGFTPNKLQERYDDDRVLGALSVEIRRLGRMPTMPELGIRHREDASIPSARTFERLGPKAGWPALVADYCRDRPELADVLALVGAMPAPPEKAEAEAAEGEPGARGFVYLLQSGGYYKIGHTLDVGRRRYDLAIQLPDPVTEVHVIATDDPAGIERYWHDRFRDRRKNGEWFELSKADISAFKRRKFM